AAQRGLIGKTRKAKQGKEGSVVLQDVGFVDASQARHDRVEEGQNEIRGMVVGIALGYAYPLLQQTAKSELVAKTLQQYHSPEVSQMSLAKGKTQCSQGLGHVGRTIARGFSPCTQTPLKVNFVCRAIYSPRSAKILCLAKILVPSSRFIEDEISWRLDESAIGWLACEAPTFSSPQCSATYRPNSGCRRTIRCGRSDRSPTRS